MTDVGAAVAVRGGDGVVVESDHLLDHGGFGDGVEGAGWVRDVDYFCGEGEAGAGARGGV